MKKSEARAFAALIIGLIQLATVLLNGIFQAIVWLVEKLTQKAVSDSEPNLELSDSELPFHDLQARPPNKNRLALTDSLAVQAAIREDRKIRDKKEPIVADSRVGLWPVLDSSTLEARPMEEPVEVAPLLEPVLDDIFFEVSLGNTNYSSIFEYRPSREVPLPETERARDCWKAPGQAVTIKGYTIVDGMVYVGKGLRSARSGTELEPALINPSLKIAKDRFNPEGSGISYWPHYCDLSEESRASYLAWLAEGKKDPTINIAYVFLYFYGLERRLVHDRKHHTAETDQLVAEVSRLLLIYGSNSSFRSYATGLLETLKIRDAKSKLYEEAPVLDPRQARSSKFNQVAIAQLVNDGKPISEDWALAWAFYSDVCQFRTPAKRLPDMFQTLFRQHYRRKYGAGMKVRPNKTRLNICYFPASSSLKHNWENMVGDLPDPMGLTKPKRNLQALVDYCQDELEPVSRWLGRNPDQANSIRAWAMVPKALVEEAAHPPIQEWKTWLGQVTSRRTILGRSELTARWPFPNPEQPGKSETVEFVTFLEKLGYGIEPDPRFPGPSLAQTRWVALFSLGDQILETATPEYRSAALILHLAALVAWADDSVSDAEERQLEEKIENSLHLNSGERRRLRAHLSWLLQEKPSMNGLKKKIADLDDENKHEIGNFILTMAGADGTIEPAEIKVLETLYKTLGLDPNQVISLLHQLSSPTAYQEAPPSATNQRAPTAVNPATPSASPQPATRSFKLNPEILEARRKETERIARVLSEIFQEEEEVQAPPPIPLQTSASPFQGLDANHYQLLLWLVEKDERERQEVELFCSGLGLFPDGALETINELAFERCDKPLFEDGEIVEIYRETYEEMVA